MLVSVIIPNYNGALWLERTVGSCLAQGEEYLKEIIIVDDNSQDGSWDILVGLQNDYSPYVKIYQNVSKGANAARNQGFARATGKYIQWLDADDQLIPGKWAVQIAAFQSNSTLDVVLSDFFVDFYENGLRIDRQEKVKHSMHDFLEEILRDNWSACSAYLLTYSLAERLFHENAWNENRQVNQDREYFTHAGLLGAKAGYVPGYYSVYNVWSSTSIRYRYLGRKYYSISDILLRTRKRILTSEYISGARCKTYIQIINAQLLDTLYFQRDMKLPYQIPLLEVDWLRGGKAKLRWGLYTRFRLLRAWLWHRFGV